MISSLPVADATRFSDDELVRWILAGETGLFELLMRRYNQRLYRAARAILRDDAEAEDVAQDAWVRAYQHLRQFEGRASFSTWLTRIGVHEALSRLRRRSRKEEIDGMTESRRDSLDAVSTSASTPEQLASNNEARSLLEQAIDSLPDAYRETFVLRDVEGMSTAETAESLSISEENVKTRLHRARALLRKELYARAGATSSTAFHFLGARCDRMVTDVMDRIQVLPGSSAADSSIAEPS
jgi:RNA polymerase sigma-70 factor (ECF subfamily)